MRPKLNDAIPWSEEETGGVLISAILSSVIFTVLLEWAMGPEAGTMTNPHVPMNSPAYKVRIPDPNYVPPWVIGCAAFVLILVLNMSPIKKLHGFLQFLFCVLAGVVATQHRWSASQPVGIVVYPLFAGLAIFLLLRVNWWFWWDVPSRRSVGRRMAASIFFTGVPWLGLGFAVWRLVFGVGVHDMTTQFIKADDQSGKVLETIIEDPALAEHARRMETIRAAKAGMGPGRKPSEAKATVSESI